MINSAELNRFTSVPHFNGDEPLMILRIVLLVNRSPFYGDNF